MHNALDRSLANLQAFFKDYSLDFEGFTHRYGILGSDLKVFCSYLTYCIYYNELPRQALKGHPEFLLLKLYVESNDKKILPPLSEKKALALAVNCMQYQREGSYYILEALRDKYSNNPDWQTFLLRLQTGYYDPRKYSEKSENIQDVLRLLDAVAAAEVARIDKLLNNLLINILDLPDTSGRIRQLFAPFIQEKYSLDELKAFFEIFGLRGYTVSTSKVNASLEEVLQSFQEALQQLASSDTIIFFLLSLCRQLYAFCRSPGQYIQGLDRLVYTVATRGRDFPTQFWLPSVLCGLAQLAKHAKISLKKYPLIIFDQSEKGNFLKNGDYIRELEKKYQAVIFHLSPQQTLKLARKLKLVDSIRTSPDRAFGFGGARNCTLLLAPLLYAAFKVGYTSLDEILQTNGRTLQLLFKNYVSQPEQDSLVHMGEDDIYVPVSYIFSDALFAYYYKDAYILRANQRVGRAGHILNLILDLNTVIAKPSQVFSHTAWLDKPSLVGMSGALSKPKFCLSLPFGSEESHVKTLRLAFDLFQQPVVHLAGPRFPKKLLPRSPLDGIEHTLKHTLPYIAQISMVINLIDPSNKINRCILPWNDKEVIEGQSVQSLSQLIAYAKSASTLRELQKRFWRNMGLLFSDGPPKKGDLREYIESLTTVDPPVKVSAALLRFYQKVQQDALFFLALGRTALEYHKQGQKNPHVIAKKEVEGALETKMTDKPMSKGLYLLMDKVVSGKIVDVKWA